MRQHVNPLSRFFQLPLKLPEPMELFYNYELPIHLDIGCARGQFLLQMASLYPDWNYLGVEIRNPLVIAAEKERVRMGLTNLRFLFCNANVSLEDWLSALPAGLLQRVSIQFPDPWFKRRHQKRRVLQIELLHSLGSVLCSGNQLFIQSDFLDVIEQMSGLIELSSCFSLSKENNNEYLKKNPLSIPTERELYCIQKGLLVYRKLYLRNKKSFPSLDKFREEFEALETI